jgi:hypothetical protein
MEEAWEVIRLANRNQTPSKGKSPLIWGSARKAMQVMKPPMLFKCRETLLAKISIKLSALVLPAEAWALVLPAHVKLSALVLPAEMWALVLPAHF